MRRCSYLNCVDVDCSILPGRGHQVQTDGQGHTTADLYTCADEATLTVWILTVPSWLAVATRSRQMDKATQQLIYTHAQMQLP